MTDGEVAGVYTCPPYARFQATGESSWTLFLGEMEFPFHVAREPVEVYANADLDTGLNSLRLTILIDGPIEDLETIAEMNAVMEDEI